MLGVGVMWGRGDVNKKNLGGGVGLGGVGLGGGSGWM